MLVFIHRGDYIMGDTRAGTRARPHESRIPIQEADSRWAGHACRGCSEIDRDYDAS